MFSSFKKVISSLLLVAVFCFPVAGKAQVASADIAQILEEIKAKVQTFLDAFKDYYGISLDGDYVAPTSFVSPDLDKIKSNLTKLKTLGTGPTNTRGEKITEKAILDLLTSPPNDRLCTNCKSEYGVDSVSQMKSNLLSQGDFPYPYLLTGELAQYGNISGNRIKQLREKFNNNELKTNQALDFDTLLSPLAFSTEVTENKPSDLEVAKRYILLSSGLANPVRVKNTLDPVDQEKFELTGKNPRDEYLIKLLTYVSRRAVGVSNLNQIFANRIKPDANTPSKAELDHTMATRRMTAKWHDDMETASPLTVQRELLYLLADMNYQLYQTRIQNERLLATVSVFQLQSLDLSKSGIK